MAVARPIEEVSEAAGPLRVSFENGGAFLSEVRGEVERYLASPHTRTRGRIALYAKSAVALPLLAVSWAVLMFVQPGLLLGLLCLLGCAVGAVLTGFCVQHDANHGAYFQSRRLNHLMGWSTDALLGFSSHAWRVKHNVAHHTYTNVDGYDDDINQTPFARMMPSQPSRPWYRLQHVYIWPLYCLMLIRWQIGADAAALVRGRIGNSAIRMPRRWDLVGLVAGKAFFVTWALVIPLLVYPWWVVAAGYAGFAMVASLVTATTFQLAHCVEEAAFVSPEELDGHEAAVGGARGRVDRRLLPPQRRAHVAARRPQLPDRAPSVPARAAHALPAHRRDRAPQGRRARRPLHRPAVAPRRAPIAPAPPPRSRPARPAGRDRDGLELLLA